MNLARFFGLAAALALLPAPAVAQENLDRRIAARPGGRLQVDLDFGEEARADRVSLEVRSHDADEVWVVADLSGLGASTVSFRVESEGDVVRLYGRAGGVMSWIFGGPGVAVRVWVPRTFSIDVRCASGPISIEDIAGDIRARTVDSGIDVRGAEGPVSLRSRSGAIKATEITGDVTVRASAAAIDLSWVEGDVSVRTGHGDIAVRHIAGAIELRSDAGEIGVREQRGTADVKTERGAVYASFASAPAGLLETSWGSVELVLPASAGVELDARSARGTVSVADGISAEGDRGQSHFRGKLNGGGAPLRVYTTRGAIRVERR